MFLNLLTTVSLLWYLAPSAALNTSGRCTARSAKPTVGQLAVWTSALAARTAALYPQAGSSLPKQLTLT